MSQTIRSFIAFELPDAVISLLGNIQQGLTSLRLKARWVRPGNIHLTLKFLGNINPGDIEAIGRAMDDTAGAFDPFTLTVGGLGVFPGVRRARVVWIGLGGETQALHNLQQNLEERLAGVGFPRENRSFKAHLTLGRFRQAPNPRIIGQAIEDFADSMSQNFTAERIILFQSDLKPTGAEYSKLKQAKLRNEN